MTTMKKEKVKILWIGYKNNNISTANRPGITLGKKKNKEKRYWANNFAEWNGI